jgi:hypothetical protein
MDMFCVKNCKSLQCSLNFTKMVIFKSQRKMERPEIDLTFTSFIFKTGSPAMELHCAIQKYAWGKLGTSSLVAQLSQANPTAAINEKDPYAELWMGTHPSGPSKIANSSELLLDYLKSNLNSLGDKERNTFGEDLPFLFKALSVAKALSIQAHPEKVCIIIGPVVFVIP